MLASLLSCATRAFFVDSIFCAHSLVARPHLSIRVCVSMCHWLLLVYLFHLQICESLSTLLTLANILHQIFVPLSSPSSTQSFTCLGVSEQVRYQFHHSFTSHWVTRDTSSTLGKGNLVLFISFPTHLYSTLVMDRQGISPSIYKNNDEFDATKNNSDAKMQAQMEEIKALIKSYKRSSSSSRRRSRAHASELPSPARSHRHQHHHQEEC